MKPYDWCDPRCPDPCTCQDEIERRAEESEGYAPDDPKNPAYVEAVLDRADLDRKRAKGEP